MKFYRPYITTTSLALHLVEKILQIPQLLLAEVRDAHLQRNVEVPFLVAVELGHPLALQDLDRSRLADPLLLHHNGAPVQVLESLPKSQDCLCYAKNTYSRVISSVILRSSPARVNLSSGISTS